MKPALPSITAMSVVSFHLGAALGEVRAEQASHSAVSTGTVSFRRNWLRDVDPSASIHELAPPLEKGMALGLFSQDAQYSYRALVDEIVDLGVTHLSLPWIWWQKNVSATEIKPHERWSAAPSQVIDTIRYAKQRGLHVTLFPIVRLVERTRHEWRGKIRPTDERDWWASYGAFILQAAEMTSEAGADRLSVGSELLSRESMRREWADLIDRVRVTAPTVELMYSANWDHFREVSFWDLVDVVGLTAYWELTKDLDPSVPTLTHAWAAIRWDLLEFSRMLGRPFVFTEVGYPSLDGGAAWPWDETRRAPVDLEEQRRAYEAFVRAWSGTRELQGTYFWTWFGFGGPTDTNYTPRGKPASSIVRAWYRKNRN